MILSQMKKVEDGERGSTRVALYLQPTISKTMVLSCFTEWFSICKPPCLRLAGMADHSWTACLPSTPLGAGMWREPGMIRWHVSGRSVPCSQVSKCKGTASR